MSKYIRISNQGIIDSNAFMLMGASTKRGEQGKIGFFGSGLKYALAVLIRNKINFHIYAGNREIPVTTQEKIFRDHKFNQIIIDGQETGLTAEMGVDWEPWFSVREIFCNALDEKGGKIEMNCCIEPQQCETHFYIEECELIRDIIKNWHDCFSVDRQDKVLDTPELKVFMGDHEKYIVYRRGVQCHLSKKKSIFHYDCRDIEINESRTLKHSVDSCWHVSVKLAKHADKEVIREFFDKLGSPERENYFEYMFSWAEYLSAEFNDNWLEVIEGRNLIIDNVAGYFVREISKGNCLILPGRLVHALRKHFKKKVNVLGMNNERGDFVLIDPEAKHIAHIDQCKAFFKDCGIDIPYEIRVAQFEDGSRLGCIMSGEIILSTEAFKRGKRIVAETVFEEYIHLKYEVMDETRGMQDVLITETLNQMEERLNVFL